MKIEKKNIYTIGITFALALMFLACTLAFVISALKSGRISSSTTTEKEYDGTELESGKTYALSDKMLFTSVNPQADESITLVAKIEPEYADDQTVDWSVEWVNANSTWAKGKTVTNYVRVTPTSSGALTAKVNCLSAFGEKINIKVKSRSNPNAVATCTVDYAKRIQNMKVKFYGNSGLTGSVFHTMDTELGYFQIDYYDKKSNNGYYWAASDQAYGDGTVADTFTYSVHFSRSDDLIFQVEQAQYPTTKEYQNTELLQGTAYRIDGAAFCVALVDIEGIADYEEMIKTAHNYIRWQLKASVGVYYGTITIKAKGKYSEFSSELEYIIDPESLAVEVNSVSIGQTAVTV